MHVPEQYRIRSGPMGSDTRSGNNGAFMVKTNKQTVAVVASCEGGWQHVSVSRRDRCPTWEEMCEVKDLFWGENVWVLQFHPARQDYVNCHPYCLHMWRPVGVEIMVPPSWMVGPSEKVA